MGKQQLYYTIINHSILLKIKTLTECEKCCKLFAPESNLSHKGTTEKYVAATMRSRLYNGCSKWRLCKRLGIFHGSS